MSVTILVGDCRDVLSTLPAGSAQCVVTSPPYFGLRDYGVAGQIGMEPTPDAYVETLVTLFRDMRRVLRDDGTLWLNLGDSYTGSGKGGNPADSPHTKQATNAGSGFASTYTGDTARTAAVTNVTRRSFDLGPKQLIGIPWRVALALQADGWTLRQDIIWHKPNPMPESVQDRCTKAHEYVFLLSKSERYYYDIDAVREPATSAWDPDNAKSPDGWDTGEGSHGAFHRDGREKGRSGNKARKPATERDCPRDGVAGSVPWEGETRNRRSVWTVATAPFSGAHFATFPPALIEPCIKAGSRVGDMVLDPFGGAGTTGLVADRLGRNATLIELNPAYAQLARERIMDDAPLLVDVDGAA